MKACRRTFAPIRCGAGVVPMHGFVLSHDDAYSSGAIARCLVSLPAIATPSMLAPRNLTAVTCGGAALRGLNRATPHITDAMQPLRRSIVEAHGGRIWAEPLATGGALFQIVLPIDEGSCHEQ